MTLISVITPSLNQGQFIQATLDSVLQQDYADIEYMVRDGGSTDETIEILRRCNDPRLKWASESDKGQSDAINKGLQ
jgi:glycosyltransferase involved in cell wall biosynthesis